MAATHKHGDRVCKITPKSACDLILRQDDHFHPGKECEMWLKPGNVKETCALEAPRKAEYMQALSLLAKGTQPSVCLACEFGGPHHVGPDCKRRRTAAGVT